MGVVNWGLLLSLMLMLTLTFANLCECDVLGWPMHSGVIISCFVWLGRFGWPVLFHSPHRKSRALDHSEGLVLGALEQSDLHSAHSLIQHYTWIAATADWIAR